jgi:hypothetical protein
VWYLRFEVFCSLMLPLDAVGVVALLLLLLCQLMTEALKLLVPGQALSLV